MNLKNPIIVALDVDEADQAIKLAAQLKSKVGAFKLGPRLIVRYGQDFIQKIAQQGPVFVDNKYFDIPSTMLSAIQASFDSGASLCTIHALSGQAAMSEVATLEKKLNQKRPFKILAVTVLTSFTEETLPVPLKTRSVAENVSTLCYETFEAGLTGIVCSPHEVKALKLKHPTGYFVTPGVRMSLTDMKSATNGNDQARVETPKAALAAGASALVIGRPIVAAQDPERACDEIIASLRVN